MARKKRTTKKDELKIKEEIKVTQPEIKEENKEESQDLTINPTVEEIKDKVDLSDTAVAIDEIQDKIKIEEIKEEEKQEKKDKIKENKKENKITKKQETQIKETEAHILPPFDIDEDFFTNERKRKTNYNDMYKTYVIDQLL